MSGQLNLMQGTLDMLILKAVSLSSLHGYGVPLQAGGLGLTPNKIWVPHLRDGLIVAKVGIRAAREPITVAKSVYSSVLRSHSESYL